MPKKEQPKVSMIVVVYNGEKFLPKLLNSLKKTRYPNYEIILVDNASNDNSVKFVIKSFPDVKIVKNKMNKGFAEGCNEGIKFCSADSEYFVILNQDMYVHPDWLSYLVKIAEADKKIGLVGYSRLVPGGDKIEMLGHKSVNENLAKFKKIGAGQGLKEFLDKEVVEVAFCLGLMKMSVLKEVGLFDEKTFAMYEEVDLCRRIKDAGYKIVVNPRSKVWHFGSQSIKKTSTFRIYHSYKNRLRYVLKHNKGFAKLFYVDVLCLIYFFKILKFSFQGKFNLSWAIVKGVLWNIKNFKDYF